MPPGSLLSAKQLTRAARTFWVAVVFMFLLILGRPRFTSASVPVHGIGLPVVAIQFARDPADVELVLGEYPSLDRITMRFKQYEDFALIAAYVGLFVTLGTLLTRRAGVYTILGIASAMCGIAAGIFDVLEDRAILAVLDVRMRDTTQNMVNSIIRASTAKWALTAVALGALSTYFLGISRWYARTTGWFAAVMAVAIAALSIYFRKFAP
jgi:hypothetical protein